MPRIDLSGSDFVIITGPNNSGKSTFLREIVALLRPRPFTKPDTQLLHDVDLRSDVTADEVLAYIRANFGFSADGNTVLLGNNNFALPNLGSSEGVRAALHSLSDAFSYYADTGSRLQEVAPAALFDRVSGVPTTPVQKLYADDESEKQVSSKFKRAFQSDLIVHRSAGGSIPLYMGVAPEWTKEHDRTSTEYALKLQGLDRLELQGDGVKAFAGLLLRMMTFGRSILLIDEPEAFLHPPQARLLGLMLAEEHKAGTQVFVATHSPDFIQGVIEAKPKDLKLGRLSRTKNENQLHWLETEKTEKFLSDTLLKTTNALSGLFYKQVFLTEADRDSVFYREMLLAVTPDDTQPDALFINTNGKDRMPDFVSALADLGIEAIVIADIDLIRTESTLRKLVELRKGDADLLCRLASQIVREVESVNVPSSSDTVRGRVNQILDLETGAKPPSKEAIAAISSLLAELKPFSAVKRAGARALPKGECQARFARLKAELEGLKIFLVVEGELEGFYMEGGAKGAKWLHSVLALDLKAAPELNDARRFVKHVAGIAP